MNLTDLIKTEFPLIQGGMANIATGAFAASVSNAGALGLIAGGGMSAQMLREQIAICRELTDKPFGVNIMLLNPEAEAMAHVVAEEKIQVVTTGAGSASSFIPLWKDAGCTVIPVVASTALAVRAQRSGADAVIAEGGEAGGHVGDMTTMNLVPQLCASIDLPVIAAGGIATGRQLAAAYMLGAIGAQIGTCLLVSEECPIHENYKNAVIKAGDNATLVTGRIAGTPVRVLKNQMARQYVQKEREGMSKEELELYTLGSLRRAVFDGDTKSGSLMAGQSAGLCNEILSLRTILETIMHDAKSALSTAGTLL